MLTGLVVWERPVGVKPSSPLALADWCPRRVVREERRRRQPLRHRGIQSQLCSCEAEWQMLARANGCPHGAVEVDEHLFVLRPQTMLQTVVVGDRPGGSFAVGSGSLW